MSMRYCLRWHCMLGLFLKIYNRTVSCIVEFTDHLLSDRDTTSSTGMEARGNGNNQWEWEGNENKTRLNLGSQMGMGINHWEWNWKRHFHTPLSVHVSSRCVHVCERCVKPYVVCGTLRAEKRSFHIKASVTLSRSFVPIVHDLRNRGKPWYIRNTFVTASPWFGTNRRRSPLIGIDRERPRLFWTCSKLS